MRILQVGFGTIGKEIWKDYQISLKGHDYMVIDRDQQVPQGYGWDGQPVDLAVLVVNTPAEAGSSDGFEYGDLIEAVEEYLPVAGFILIRSTVGLGFFDLPVYAKHRAKIGFAPEFYGATKYSNRDTLDMGFSIFSRNVPIEFALATGEGEVKFGNPEEIVMAKLAENAFLATKVTFFHELAMTCENLGLDFEKVREIVTSDPRINPRHSMVEEWGWLSHCFSKDVPAYVKHGAPAEVVKAAISSNQSHLLPARFRGETPPHRTSRQE